MLICWNQDFSDEKVHFDPSIILSVEKLLKSETSGFDIFLIKSSGFLFRLIFQFKILLNLQRKKKIKDEKVKIKKN